jgi:hypothetical protein
MSQTNLVKQILESVPFFNLDGFFRYGQSAGYDGCVRECAEWSLNRFLGEANDVFGNHAA